MMLITLVAFFIFAPTLKQKISGLPVVASNKLFVYLGKSGVHSYNLDGKKLPLRLSGSEVLISDALNCDPY